MEATGTITTILPVQAGVSKSGKEWKRQTFVIEIDPQSQYPKHIAFDVMGDEKIAVVSALQAGQQVEVQFDVDAHEWNGRWFNNVNAWKIELVAATNQPRQQTSAYSPAQQAVTQATQTVAPAAAPAPKQNDLPF